MRIATQMVALALLLPFWSVLSYAEPASGGLAEGPFTSLAGCIGEYDCFTLNTGAFEVNLCVTPQDTVLAMGANLGSLGLLWRKELGNSWKSVSLLGGITPGWVEGELACAPAAPGLPSGTIALVSSLGALGVVWHSANDGVTFQDGLPHVVPHESRRPRMTIGARLEDPQQFDFIKGAGFDWWWSHDGINWIPLLVGAFLGKTMAPFGVTPPPPVPVAYARYAQSSYYIAGHPSGSLLIVDKNFIYHSKNRVDWFFWEPKDDPKCGSQQLPGAPEYKNKIQIKFPKEMVWDEAGNLYLLGSDAENADLNLYYQVSRNGGCSFSEPRKIFTGTFDSSALAGQSAFGESVIGSRPGEFHVGFSFDDKLHHLYVSDAHLPSWKHTVAVAHDPPGGIARSDYVRVALDSTYSAVLGWGGDNDAWVVFQKLPSTPPPPPSAEFFPPFWGPAIDPISTPAGATLPTEVPLPAAFRHPVDMNFLPCLSNEIILLLC